MGNPTSNINGITFTENSTSPGNAPGSNASFRWVQLLTDKFQYLQPNQKQQCLSSGYPNSALDNLYPYATVPGSGTTTNDSPSGPTLGTRTPEESENARVFNATMYLMWNPALPSGCTPPTTWALHNLAGTTYVTTPGQGCTSIPIPLGAVSWSTCADAINTLNSAVGPSQWTLGCEVPQSASNGPAFNANSGFPQWQQTSQTSITVNQNAQTPNDVCAPEAQ
jgi:hypothetical protein